MNEWIYSLGRITVSQVGTPRNDDCVRLPVSWKPVFEQPKPYTKTEHFDAWNTVLHDHVRTTYELTKCNQRTCNNDIQEKMQGNGMP